jgi:hypothetical protein
LPFDAKGMGVLVTSEVCWETVKLVMFLNVVRVTGTIRLGGAA